jgi:DHA1 family bicyclomycin/chloramphenicol resistance-like MFS transporter
MHTQTLRTAIVLGLLTAIGPFGIDMYLPVLPELARGLEADSRLAQTTLASYFLALGVGQLFAGPLSDIFGRKRPIYFGLALFLLASIGCALATSIEVLIFFRLLQGLGACSCMVTPRAIVRDLYTGPEAARLMSLLLTVYSVSPILAPALGSQIAVHAGWRWVFGALAAAAGAAFWAVLRLIPETRKARPGSLRSALGGYRELLSDLRFLRIAATTSLALGSFFVYVSHSSFVMTSHYGVSPRTYSILFALNAVGLVVVSQWNSWFARRLGLSRTVAIASWLQTTVAILLVALLAAGADSLWLLVTLLVMVYGCNGILVPSLFVLGMEGRASRAGSASALIGTMNFAGGALIIAAAAPFADGQPLPMAVGVACCAALACVLGMFGSRPREPQPGSDGDAMP